MMMRRKERPEAESTTTTQKVVFDLEFPSNALCTNREGSLLAVAGRKVFRILQIGSDVFEPAWNLRDLPHKQLNLNYSTNDVQWNHKDDSQLATAPTNGSVLLWDLNKRSKSKLAYAFENSHQRAVNKLSFHPRDPHTLLSGSQDSWMIIFDTRSKEPGCRFKGPDSVRDVKFAALPVNDNLFAACYDSGTVHIWDRRHGEHPLKNLSSLHSGPAYSCAWHEQENWIVSAGRDKIIKVIDLQQSRAREKKTVHAMFSVARVKWRPGHKYHITSCSHFLDNMVAIWDFRRSFVPFASFTEHTDDVTDFLWLNDQVMLSCSKDCKLIQQNFTEADRPTEKMTPVGLSFGAHGCLALASSITLGHKNKALHSNNSQTSRSPVQQVYSKKTDQDSYQDTFLLHTSQLQELDSKALPKDHFVTCAKSYKLHGLPIHELCDCNYKVDSMLGREDVAQTWLIMKLLYCNGDPDCSKLGLIQTRTPVRGTAQGVVPNLVVDGVGDIMSPSVTGGKESVLTENKSLHVPKRETTYSADEEDEDAEENIAADVSADLDFFEFDDKDSDIGQPQNLVQHPQQDWGELPAEPFQLRDHIVQRPSSPEHDSASALSVSVVESSSSLRQHQHEGLAFQRVSEIKPQWNYSSVVANVLRFYANQGNVQVSVSALLVLGEHGKNLVDELTIEQWFQSYIDLLMQYQLWCEAALVIKLCPLQEVNQRNQQSTSYHTGCGNCNKLMESRGWQCHRCEKIASFCSVCHSTVRGLFMWCQVCGHGGHLQHMQEWHKSHPQCPAGCGHNCTAARTLK